MKTPEISIVSRLFEQPVRYSAPVFQRLYVWGKRQLNSMIEDIETVDPKLGQFLGAIVLKDLGKPEGPGSPTNYLLIDGQQRLTTFYLFFVALARVARDNHDVETAAYIVSNFLAQSKNPRFKGRPKLVPTLQDRVALWSILETELPDFEWDLEHDKGEDRKNPKDAITPQWNRLLNYCAKAFYDTEGRFLKDEFDRVLRTLEEQLNLIVITLENFDDANAIFSRLNAEGVPLELADLVRNEVFSKFNPDESDKAERFYLKNWEPFEKDFDGTLDQFFPIYSQIVFRGKATKSNAFPSLQERWSESKPQTILTDLQKYAPFYLRLARYSNHSQLGNETNRLIERFSRMPRTTVTWPFLIEVLKAASESRIDAREANKDLRIVESFLVRRSIMGLEPTGLHAVFKTLWEKTKGSPKAVLEKIVTRTIQVPTDAEIRQSLMENAVDTRVVLRYILRESEREYTEKNGFDHAQTVATIEHVAPQNLTDDWKKVFTRPEHARVVGLIGNLAALSEKQNKSLQDQPWEDKRARFRGSDFKTTQALAAKKVWNSDAILNRTEDLARWIVQRWPPLDTL